MDEKQRYAQEEVSERIEHRDVLLNIRAILKTAAGRGFFKYLVKYYSPIELTPMGLEGAILHEGLGQLRAYNELFKLISEADSKAAGELLAENIKEQYDKLFLQDVDGQG